MDVLHSPLGRTLKQWRRFIITFSLHNFVEWWMNVILVQFTLYLPFECLYLQWWNLNMHLMDGKKLKDKQKNDGNNVCKTSAAMHFMMWCSGFHGHEIDEEDKITVARKTGRIYNNLIRCKADNDGCTSRFCRKIDEVVLSREFVGWAMALVFVVIWISAECLDRVWVWGAWQMPLKPFSLIPHILNSQK